MYGIVTFQDGINFGAFLQVYALQHFLSNAGIENEIINYKNPDHWINEYKCFLWCRNPFFLYSNLKKILKFRREQRKLRKTRFFKNFKAIKLKQYEGIFFGSDEIWNFKLPLFGKDLFYFGQSLSSKKFIAYAVSFGNLNQDAAVPEDVKSLIQKFDNLSVRDNNSAKILKAITNRPVQVTLDPTLLYNFLGEEKLCHDNDFIMVYTPGFDKDVEQKVKAYAAEKGKKLISVGYRNRFCDINRISLDPFEFLGYCNAASEIITNMFHGVIFSIKYQKNFCVISDPYRVNKIGFLKTLKLEDRILQEQKSIGEILSRKINYAQVEKILDTEKQKSENFIFSSIAN